MCQQVSSKASFAAKDEFEALNKIVRHKAQGDSGIKPPRPVQLLCPPKEPKLLRRGDKKPEDNQELKTAIADCQKDISNSIANAGADNSEAEDMIQEEIDPTWFDYHERKTRTVSRPECTGQHTNGAPAETQFAGPPQISQQPQPAITGITPHPTNLAGFGVAMPSLTKRRAASLERDNPLKSTSWDAKSLHDWGSEAPNSAMRRDVDTERADSLRSPKHPELISISQEQSSTIGHLARRHDRHGREERIKLEIGARDYHAGLAMGQIEEVKNCRKAKRRIEYEWMRCHGFDINYPHTQVCVHNFYRKRSILSNEYRQ